MIFVLPANAKAVDKKLKGKNDKQGKGFNDLILNLLSNKK